MRWRIAPTPVVMLAMLTFFAWGTLECLRPQALWVNISTSRMVRPGQNFEVQLYAGPDLRTGVLSADLHADLGTPPVRRIFPLGSAALHAHQSEYALQLSVPPTVVNGRARVVVYASPAGDWNHRTHAAISEPIPIRTDAETPATSSGSLKAQTLSPYSDHPEVPRTRSRTIQIFGALVWACCAIVSRRLLARSTPDTPNAETLGTIATYRRVPFLFAAVAISECLDLPRILSADGRFLARWFSAYTNREQPLQIASALALAGTALLAQQVCRGSWPAGLRLSTAAGILQLGLSAIDAFSLHLIDELAAIPILNLPTIQWLSLLACAASALGLGSAWIRDGVHREGPGS